MNFIPTIFWQKFREINAFTARRRRHLLKLQEELIWRNRYSIFHSVKIREFYCHLSMFSQNFRESNFLLNNFTLNWFDEKEFKWRWICRFFTFSDCIPRKLSSTCLWQNYVKLTYFFKSKIILVLPRSRIRENTV